MAYIGLLSYNTLRNVPKYSVVWRPSYIHTAMFFEYLPCEGIGRHWGYSDEQNITFPALWSLQSESEVKFLTNNLVHTCVYIYVYAHNIYFSHSV